MKFIIGEKIGMTRVFDQDGRIWPATLLKAGPVFVIQLKKPLSDGYGAVQVGFGRRRAKRINRAQKGQWKDLGSFRLVREFRLPEADLESFSPGQKIEVSDFSLNQSVAVSAVSKGKGFQGVVKRHGFAGGSRTHGQKHSEREPGSIGGGGRAGGRVIKNMKMAGRMGGRRVTVKNLNVLSVNAKDGQLVLSGAVPGRRGTLVEIRGK